jgi:hypothetical protein
MPINHTILGWWATVREFKESNVEHVYSNINKTGEGYLTYYNKEAQ